MAEVPQGNIERWMRLMLAIGVFAILVFCTSLLAKPSPHGLSPILILMEGLVVAAIVLWRVSRSLTARAHAIHTLVERRKTRLPGYRISYPGYRPLADSGVQAFAETALLHAISLFGDPAVPVRQVRLYVKEPATGKPDPGKGYSFASFEDPTQGVFAVYLVIQPSRFGFHETLAHEVAHLLNVRLYDCYMEGLATLFAEKALHKMGLGQSWIGWEGTAFGVHAASYRMMKEISLAMDSKLKTILKYAVASPDRKGAMEIDIDGWIDSLGEVGSAWATAIIADHASAIEQGRQMQFPEMAFRLPNGIERWQPIGEGGTWYADWLSKLKR